MAKKIKSLIGYQIKCYVCGEDGASIDGRHSVEIFNVSALKDDYFECQAYDLCDDCIKDLKDWFEMNKNVVVY
jgi:hypothetical protein